MPTAPVTAGTPIRATARPALFAAAPPLPDSLEALVLPLPSLWLAPLVRSRAFFCRPELACRLALFRALLRPLDPPLERDALPWLLCARDPLLFERATLLRLLDPLPSEPEPLLADVLAS